jgi:hypothetical protein
MHVYAAVRRDLSGSQQAVQAIHAAVEAARLGLITADGEHPHLVLLGVADEESLLILERRLRLEGVGVARFVEPDLGDSVTAIATEPIDRDRTRLFRRIPLLQLGGR